jgi:hypothetical protein
MSRSRLLRSLLFAAVAAIIGACASLDRLERNAIFKPTRDVTETPASHGAAYEELWEQGTGGHGTASSALSGNGRA